MAKQFIAAYNEGDKAAIYELFPEFKSYKNLLIEGSVGDGDKVSVEKDDSTGLYTVTINELKKQRLVFSADSSGVVSMVDAYGAFHLDSIANEIALKTGVPVKKLSDVELAKLMDSQSEFIRTLLKDIGTAQLYANYGAYSWSRSSRGLDVLLNFTVSNSTSQTILGKDYYLIITPSQASTGTTFANKTVDGVDIAPGEIKSFSISYSSLFNYANNRDLSYRVDVRYRTESSLAFLLNYGSFEGKEYEEYLAHPHRAKVLDMGEDYVISAEKKGVAFARKEMNNSSDIVDTLFHRQLVKVIWDTEKWASIYNREYQFVGYVKVDDLVRPDILKPIYVEELTLKSENGKPISIYSDNPNKSDAKIVKTYNDGTKVLIDRMDWDNVLVYERQTDGSIKKVGHVKSDNVSFGEAIDEGEDIPDSLPDLE